jgi:fructose-1,6-bisphosphatase/inositol monophosphatase family enzyme
VREAGGLITDFSGTRFSIHDDEILASNGRVHQHMIDILQKVMRNAE